MTTPCQQNVSADGLYVVRHNPPHYFLDIPAAGGLAYNLPYPALATDMANHTLPAYAFITPNLLNDMHTGSTDNSCHVPLLVISPYGRPGVAPTT